MYRTRPVGGPSMHMSCHWMDGGIVNRSVRRLATAFGAALVVAGLMVAGCSGSGGQPAAGSASPTAAATGGTTTTRSATRGRTLRNDTDAGGVHPGGAQWGHRRVPLLPGGPAPDDHVVP